MAETLLWVLPLVPTMTALVMLTTRDRRMLSAIAYLEASGPRHGG